MLRSLKALLAVLCIAIVFVLNERSAASASTPPVFDSTFGSGGKTVLGNEYGTVIAMPDGGSIFASEPSTTSYRLQRFNSTGHALISFGTNGIINFDNGGEYVTVQGVVPAPDNSIYVSLEVSGSSAYNQILRHYLSNGSIDTAFGINGDVFQSVLAGGYARAFIRLTNGKFAQVGTASTRGNEQRYTAFAQFLADGSPDLAFGNNGISLILNGPDYFALREGPNGTLIAGGAAGASNSYAFSVVRLLANGQFDPTFGEAGFADVYLGGEGSSIFDVRVKQDGSILLSGDVAGYDTRDSRRNSTGFVARLLPDGQFDEEFGLIGIVPVGPLDPPSQEHVAPKFLSSDSRIVVAGHYDDYVGTPPKAFVASMSACGAPDTSLTSSEYLDITGSGLYTIDTFTADTNGGFLTSGQQTSGGIVLSKFSLPGSIAAAPCVPTAVDSNGVPSGLRLNWLPPVSTGGSAITGYSISDDAGNVIANLGPSARDYTANALSDGLPYAFFVTARNANGESYPAVAIGIAGSVPSAPVAVTARDGYGQLEVGWDAPLSSGAAPIDSYLIGLSNGATRVVGAAARSTTFASLSEGSYTATVTARNAVGSSVTVSTNGARVGKPSSPSAATPSGKGYWMFGSNGQVLSYGDAAALGSITGSLNRPIVDGAAKPDGNGYWMVASDGGVFSFGSAQFYGSTGALRLNQPIVGMASTPTGNGYWLVASDGGIFSFGDARFFGSTGALKLNKPIVGMSGTPSGNGYWLVASDGGIFSFGDAQFYGSTGALKLNKPIVGMATTTSGNGYWLVASDGGIFSFGDAQFYGSTGALSLVSPIASATPTPSGHGYWMFAQDGGVFSFGDAGFFGSAGGTVRSAPIT